MKKLLQALTNLTLTAFLLLILSLPFFLPARFISQISFGGLGGLVLGIHTSEDYSNYLVYGSSKNLTGRQETVTAYAFPGQTTVYHNVYSVKNNSRDSMEYQLFWEVIGECEVGTTFYFDAEGCRDAKSCVSTWISPQEEVPISLQLKDNLHQLVAPTACKLEVTIEL